MAGTWPSHPAEDFDTSLLERRWFAAVRAASDVQAECLYLAEVLDLVQAAWRGARGRLHQSEMLRDALGEQLAAFEVIHSQAANSVIARSAA